MLGNLDIHPLGQREHHQIYAVLAAHCREYEGVSDVSFAVWAPNARRVSVVGDFNEWDGGAVRCGCAMPPACGGS